MIGALALLEQIQDLVPCLSCNADALETFCPRLRVGTTTSLSDEPVSNALKQKLYKDLATCAVDWVICPDDSSAIAAMVGAGIIDLIMVRVEDAPFIVRPSKSLRVCGTFSGIQRPWHLFGPRRESAGDVVRKTPKKLGIPSDLFGSLMACVLQDLDVFGWASDPPELVPLKSLVDGFRALNMLGAADVVLWACSELELAAAHSVCAQITNPFEVPWKSHVFLCTRETVFAKSAAIRHFFAYTNNLIKEMTSKSERGALEEYLMDTYSLTAAEVKRFLDEHQLMCNQEVDYLSISLPIQYLRRLRLLTEDTSQQPWQLRLADGVEMSGGPSPTSDTRNGCPEDDLAVYEECYSQQHDGEEKFRNPKVPAGKCAPGNAKKHCLSDGDDLDEGGHKPPSSSRALQLMPGARTFGDTLYDNIL